MIADFLVDLLCVLFLLLTGVFCLSWVKLRSDLPWRGRQWVKWTMQTLAVFIGFWNLLFGVLKLVYLLVWTVTT